MKSEGPPQHLEHGDSSPEVDQSDATSALRSADFWQDRSPDFARRLRNYAACQEELAATASGRFIIIVEDGVLPDTFDTETEAYDHAAATGQEDAGIIHQVRTEGLKTTHIYVQGSNLGALIQRLRHNPTTIRFRSTAIAARSIIEYSLSGELERFAQSPDQG